MTKLRTHAALAGLAVMAGTSIAQTPPTIYLQPNASGPYQTWIAGARYGEIDFLDQYVHGNPSQFDVWFSPLYSQEHCPLPIGDRLGYDTCALRDVDGDKYNDWAETWYHAEPVGPLAGERLHDTAVILPGSATNTPAAVRNAPLSERVGFCRIVSGVQPILQNGNHGPILWDFTSFVGNNAIWGHSDNARLAHEIASIPDIDGDGRAEVVLSSNSTEGGRGSINVYAYSNRYNLDGSNSYRWVCIWRIVGTLPYCSELAYQLQDTFADFNGDGRVDIMAASLWWRTEGNRDCGDTCDSNNPPCYLPRRQRGGGWIFLTPPVSLFTAIQQSPNWGALPGDPTVKRPLVMSEGDFSLEVHNPVQTAPCGPAPVSDLGSAGDIDGDGINDIFVTAGYIRQGAQRRGQYIYLSADGYNDVGHQTLVGAQPRYIGLNADGTDPVGPAQFTQLSLVPDNADLVIYGNQDWDLTGTSIFGMDFDNASETALGEPDIALMLTRTVPWNPGKVLMLMNVRARFGPSGPYWSDINAVQDGTTLPADIDCEGVLIPATDYPIVPQAWAPPGSPPSAVSNGAGDDPAIIGINIAGNFDGKGKLDYELSFNLVRAFFTPLHPGGSLGMFNRGDAVVLDFPPPTVSVPHPAPVQLMRIQGEDDQVDPDTSNMLNGEGDPVTGYWSKLGNQGVGINQMGCIPEPAWDQDGDGRDDLIIRAPFFPRLVTQVPLCTTGGLPCWGGSFIPQVNGRPQPYYVDGGVDYLVLSSPAQPIPDVLGQPVFLDTDADGNLDVARFIVVSTALVPEVHPYNQFAPSALHYGKSCAGPFYCDALSSTLERDTPTAGKYKLAIDFPYSFVAAHPGGCIKIDTRWRNSAGQPLCVCYTAYAVTVPDP